MPSLVFALSAVFALGAAQMTFSDGWEKRQNTDRHLQSFHKMSRSTRSLGAQHVEVPGPDVELPRVEENAIPTEPPVIVMDECNLEYSRGLAALHAQMIELYQRFKDCQAKPNPLLAEQQSPENRFI